MSGQGGGARGRCWSCNDPVGHGYRLDFFLTDVRRRYLSTPLCYPCFKTVTRVFGEQGKGTLKASYEAVTKALAPSPGSTGEGGGDK